MAIRDPFCPAVPKGDPEYQAARENLLAVLADIDMYAGQRKLIEQMIAQYRDGGGVDQGENADIFMEHFGLTESGEPCNYLDIGLDHGLSAATAQRRAEEVILFILRYVKMPFEVEEFLCEIFGEPVESRHIPYLYSKMPQKKAEQSL